MDSQERSRFYSILLFLLLLIAGGLAWWFWNKSKTYLADKQAVERRVDSLLNVKRDLEVQIDSLTLAFNGLQAENENLQGRLASVSAALRKKEAEINLIKGNNLRDLESLQGQIAALQNARTEFETTIRLLREENQQLKTENLALKQENSGLKGNISDLNDKVSDLAKKLEEQILRTQSAKFKAGAFRVEVERSNDKLTARAKKAREIVVSFDLADVPDLYHGPNKLYLAITDENGKPVASKSSAQATVEAPSGPLSITAQQTKAVVLTQTQRFSFNHQLDERIKPGHYVVAIYCDKGLLGASSFRLR